MPTTKPAKRNRRQRKRRASADLDHATQAFAKLGGTLTVTNRGDHWTIWFTYRPIVRVDWWPSTGKVVVNCHYGTSTGRKNWRRLLKYVTERLAGTKYSSRQERKPDD